MVDRPRRVVVDASVLIAFLNQEEGRFERSREILHEAEDGELELYAPTVILVEVSRWSQDADPADPDACDKLEAFLDNEWLKVVEVDRHMATIAREVVATTQVRTGVDALYVAAAKIVGAPVVYAWDQRLIDTSYEGVDGAKPPGSQAPRLDV